MALHLLLLSVLVRKTSSMAADARTVAVGGLFDLEKYENNGYSELLSAIIAVEHVNSVMEDFKLRLIANNSQCNPGIAIDALFDFIHRKPLLAFVLGSGCSDVTKALAEIVPYWNTILISHASTSPTLSKRKKYPTFFRLAPTEHAKNIARSQFITHFGWRKVATVVEDSFSLAMKSSTEFLYKNNITITESLELDNSYESLKKKMVELKAFRLDMCSSRHVWIFIGNFEAEWWEVTDTGCTLSQMRQASNGSIITGRYSGRNDEIYKVHNLTRDDFLSFYEGRNGTFPISPYAYSAFDTVWTIALAVKTIHSNGLLSSLINTSYTSRENLTNNMMDIISKIHFLGLSGLVTFDGPDRTERAALFQNQDGMRRLVAVYDVVENRLNFNCSECYEISWGSVAYLLDRNLVPADSSLILVKHLKIGFTVSCIVISICLLGIVMSFSFLIFNVYHRKKRFIKLSSPKLNNVTVLGCVCVYSGIILLSFDVQLLPDNLFSVFCHIRTFIFAVGFSMAFGSMFIKTYRVHQIFTQVNSGFVKRKDYVEDEDILYVYQTTHCNCVHMEKWLSGFYAFKGLLLLFGCYMTWETRNVSIPALNDVRYIGMSVYNVVIMSIFVVVISNVLTDEPVLAVILESVCIFISATAILCLLFIPKVSIIMRKKQQDSLYAPGFVVASKTMRFPVDDKQEQKFRAEVQNRALKKELIELEHEVQRLERLLEGEPEPYPDITEDILSLLSETHVDTSSRMPSNKSSLSVGSSVYSDDDEEKSISTEDTGRIHMTLYPPRVTFLSSKIQNSVDLFEQQDQKLCTKEIMWRIASRKLDKVEDFVEITGYDGS
ncbi:gamma-aminobutyric acid type B receptor subunit 2-like [Saccostrea echinata]|uniref:gamma-aminobutyric acid type B receptor subunit 2-like n=1 Tax=Saccostrea echinata TaxID=191078 RepID=UPI002A80E86E|nr:gamma-aminobutyric acid type B receptor subunit 2-like [Saccostrea echinata]